MAIVAREYNIPMLVGTGSAVIQTGSAIEVGADGVVTSQPDRSETFIAHVAE